jgi:hypothetical protein
MLAKPLQASVAGTRFGAPNLSALMLSQLAEQAVETIVKEKRDPVKLLP